MKRRFQLFRRVRTHLALLVALPLGTAIFLSSPPVLAAPDLALEPAVSSLAINDLVTMDLRISGASNVYAWQVDVSFDPAVVSVLSTSEGTFLTNGGFSTFFLNGTFDNGAGVVDDLFTTRLGPVPGADGAGLLAQVTFQAIGLGVSALTLENVVLFDSAAQPFDAGALSGASVTVAPPVPALGTFGTGLLVLLVLALLLRTSFHLCMANC